MRGRKTIRIYPLVFTVHLHSKLDMMKLINKYWITALGVLVGAIGGYVYYAMIGCSSGSCPITSSPVMSIIWGAVMGGLVFDMFKKKEKKQDE